GRFARSHFVQDLAWLGIGQRIDVERLIGSQMTKHTAGDGRSQPERFDRGDERVTSEGGAEPRHGLIRIRAFRRGGGRHVKVGNGPPDGFVEDVVRGRYRGRTRRREAKRAAGVAQGPEKTARRTSSATVAAAGDLHAHRHRLPRLHLEGELGTITRQPTWNGREAHPGRALEAVEALVGQNDVVAVDLGPMLRAALRTPGAPHLEQVRKIGDKVDLDGDAMWPVVEVADDEPLVARAVPQESRSAKVDD